MNDLCISQCFDNKTVPDVKRAGAAVGTNAAEGKHCMGAGTKLVIDNPATSAD